MSLHARQNGGPDVLLEALFALGVVIFVELPGNALIDLQLRLGFSCRDVASFGFIVRLPSSHLVHRRRRRRLSAESRAANLDTRRARPAH